MVKLITTLLEVIRDIIQAKGDADKEEQAILTAQEAIKAELDRRKFGTSNTLPIPALGDEKINERETKP